MSHSDPPMPHQSPPPPDSVIFPQVEYNSYLPGGVMNGCPLLKCLSITFECSLSLTSEQHTHWAKLHKQAHTRTHARALTLGVLSLRSDSRAECCFPEAQRDFSSHWAFWQFCVHDSGRRGAVGAFWPVILRHHVNFLWHWWQSKNFSSTANTSCIPLQGKKRGEVVSLLL